MSCIRKVVKSFLLLPFLTLLLLVAVTGTDVSTRDSLTDSPDRVKAIIAKQFIRSQPTLEADKGNYGLTADESSNHATLSDGVPVYLFNAGHPILSGYVFPIHAGDKPIGIIRATLERKGWSIFYVQNHLTFEQDIAEGRKLLKETDRYHLIFDAYSPIFAFQIHHSTGEETILPLRDIIYAGLTKFVPVPLKQVVEIYPKEAGGG